MSMFLACVLTVLIETPVLWLFGLRGREAVTLAVCANVVTNLTLNLAFAFLLPMNVWTVAAGEALVLAAEYALYALAFGRGWRLLLITLAANLLSFLLGLLIF